MARIADNLVLIAIGQVMLSSIHLMI